jgi:hypothetical protein
MRSAARLPRELVALVERLGRANLSIADVHREVGARAAELGVTRPSYERTRQLVQEVRLEPLVPGWGEVLLDVDLRLRPPTAILDKASGAWPMPEDAGLKRRPRAPDK